MKTILLLSFLIFSSACSTPVFNKNMVISTRSKAASRARAIETVSVEKCSYIILFIPIFYDPKNMYDELLEKAKKAGGNAIVDFQMRSSSSIFTWIYNSFCMKATGSAVVLEGDAAKSSS